LGVNFTLQKLCQCKKNDNYKVCSAIFIFSTPHLAPKLAHSLAYKHMVPLCLPLAHMGLTGSIYLTMAIAMERYFTVCHPFFKVSSPASSSISSSLQTNHSFWEEYVNPLQALNLTEKKSFTDIATNFSLLHRNTALQLEVLPSDLRQNPLYVKVYLTYSNMIIHGIFPLLFLVIVNSKIYFRIRSLCPVQQGREVRHTQVSLAIVAVFLFCHAVRWIPNIWELNQAGEEKLVWPLWVSNLSQVSHLLTVFSSSANFYIYIAKHGHPCSQSKEASETTEAVLVTNNGANSIPLPSVSVHSCTASFPSLEILTEVSTRGSVVKIDEAKLETTVVLESEQESEYGSHHQL